MNTKWLLPGATIGLVSLFATGCGTSAGDAGNGASGGQGGQTASGGAPSGGSFTNPAGGSPTGGTTPVAPTENFIVSWGASSDELLRTFEAG